VGRGVWRGAATAARGLPRERPTSRRPLAV